MSSYEAVNPNSDLAVLTQILVDHQFPARESRCTCGYRYRVGESVREHRARKIIEAGFHRPSEHLFRGDL